MRKRVATDSGRTSGPARQVPASGCELRKSGDGAAFVCRRGARRSAETTRTRVPNARKGPEKGPGSLPPPLPVWRVSALRDLARVGLVKANDCAWVARDRTGAAHGVRTVNSLVADGLASFVRGGRGVEITAAGREALRGQDRRDRAALGEVLGVLLIAAVAIAGAILAPGAVR